MIGLSMRFQNEEVVVFDCDSVLVCPVEGFMSACSSASGIPIGEKKWTTYDYFNEFGLSHAEFLQAIIEYKALETARLRPGVSAAVKLVRKAGLKSAIVTARGFHPNKLVTEQYFRAHGVHFDHIAVVGEKESKVDAIRALGKIAAFCDDLPSHLRAARDAGIDCPYYLMDQPWNSEDNEFERVASVPHLVERVLAHYRQRVGGGA
jgi:uncharacterized HAD superfamily protein